MSDIKDLIEKICSDQQEIDLEIQEAFKDGLGKYMEEGFSDETENKENN